MAKIHETALVSPEAVLGNDIEIGPFSIISEYVRIGDRTTIGPHVQVDRWTTIGEDCQVFFGSTIGNPSKDLKHKKGDRSYVTIGDRNVLREYVSVSRSTAAEDSTIIGNDNLLMNWVNIAHDSVVGDRTIMANFATLGGHVTVEDDVRIGAHAALHPSIRVGKMAMVGACSKFVQDVPPFTVADGHPAVVRGLNLVGIRSSKINPLSVLSSDTINQLKKAYRLLFRSNVALTKAIEKVRSELDPNEEVQYLLNFIENSQRGVGV